MSLKLGLKSRPRAALRPRYSIRLKAMLSAVLVLISMATALGYWLGKIDMGERVRNHQARIDHRLDSLSVSQSLAFSENDRSHLTQVLNSLADDEGIAFYAALDDQGRLLARGLGPEMWGVIMQEEASSSAGQERVEGVSRNDGWLLRFERQLERWRIERDPACFEGLVPGEEVELATRTVLHGRGDSNVQLRVGTLLIGHTKGYLDAPHTKVSSQIWMTIVVVTFLTAIVVWILTHRAIQPIYRLIDTTQAIAQEEFDRKVAVRGHDELRLLADSVNTMSDKLRDSKEALETSHRRLEDRVRQRTAKLRRALDELQVLDRMKDGFLSSISHEIRTPIASIKAFGEILMSTPDISDAEREEFVEIILTESHRLEGLVDKMFELVRLESGEMPFSFASTTPGDVITDALTAVHEAVESKNLEVCVDLHSPPDRVLWDRAMVARMIQEVLNNAIEFSPPDSRVDLECVAVDDRMRLSVRDHGAGIPADSLETVFEKFRQMGGTLTDKPQGTGLGLPMCRRIAEAHDGVIRAELPERGPGSVIVMELPFVPEAALDQAVAPQPLVAPVAAESD